MAKKILVVDDEPSIVELILVNLEDAGTKQRPPLTGTRPWPGLERNRGTW